MTSGVAPADEFPMGRKRASFARASGALVAAVGLLVLGGWTFDVTALKSVLPGLAPMKANTALCFLLGGLALWLAGARRAATTALARWIGPVCAATVVLVGMVTIGEWGFGWDLALDDFLFIASPDAAGTGHPGRMSVQSALNFLLLGTSLLLQSTGRSVLVAQWLALISGFLGALGLLGYALGVGEFLGSSYVTLIALHTAAAFVVFSAGVFCIHPIALQPGSLLIALLAMLTLTISFGGWFQFNRQRAESTRIAHQTLAAIANLKADQIARWIAERRGDAESSLNKPQARQFLAEPGNLAVREEFLDWMETVRRVNGYSAVVLLDARGTVRLAAPADAALDDACVERARSALHAQDVVFEDLHGGRSGPPVHLSFLVPIGIKVRTDQPADGVLMFQVNPRHLLYPLAQSWPTPSASAETLLVRREGNEVVFLSELRHRKGTALTLRLPIDRADLPAAQAVQGASGEMEGNDYRGIPILAAMRRIAGTPWSIVSKVDQKEIYGPIREQAWTTGAMTTLLLLAASLGVWLLWHQRGLVFVRRQLAEIRRAEDSLRSSESLLREMARLARVGAWSIDLGDRTLKWSEETFRIYELPSSSQPDVAGSIKYYHPDDQARVAAAVQATIETGQSFDFDARLITAGGNLKWAHAIGNAVVAEGRIVAVQGMFQDITERRLAEEQQHVAQAESARLLAEAERSREALLSVVEDQQEAQNEIRRLNESLERRVAERTAQLEAANQELQAFSYSVSHDLRAPLRGVDGWSLALLEDYGGQLDATARGYLQTVRAEAQRMGHLIDDLLQLSRVTRADLKRELLDLSALALGVAARLHQEQPRRAINFSIQHDLTATGDAHLLEIVLTNLLGNAAKFSGTRPVAQIEFGCEARDDPNSKARRTVFFVRDNGVGFDMASAGKLFGAFQRLHKESDFPGTGIGLATVQRIVLRHGGRIWADAGIDRGATFYFTLGEE